MDDSPTMPKPDRRRAIAMGLGATAGLLTAPARSRAAPVGAAPDVVVVGAGAFGGWTALNLQERGARVTLVDAYGPGNPHASSGGESRNIQFAYGDREIYTRWAREAWDLWRQRQDEFGRQLLFPSGSLRVRPRPVLETHAAMFRKLGLPYEMLTPDEVRHRWPQIRYDDAEALFYEKDSGVVKARESMLAVADAFTRKGGKIRIGYAVPGESRGGRLESVLVNGERISASRFVFACGPWFPKLMPEILGDRIKSPRRELFYMAPAKGDERFRWEVCPFLSDSTVYTSSDIGGGYKVAPTLLGVPMDPDDGDRLPSHFLLDQVRGYLAAHLPALADRPVLAAYVCQLERTDNDHYLIDRHPAYANAWLAGGGSGHAFKMGPKSGSYVADLVMGQPQAPELQAIFGLAAHKPVAEGQAL